ncbi:hypothetical protein [Pseudomonas poae]|uniref:Uncharacterized protein n=1 Tax=Pseudomonas poae TaxID=200451 RepID=A0A2S9EZ48_9PSED|nr:hypothetical protein [Pseudomonas poae]PRA30732.1 hypothetical protein CQZ97_09410 [Pseudomonas poae]PRC22418.1 hypothetical protein CQZ99_02380 [Pseudomonas poae]
MNELPSVRSFLSTYFPVFMGTIFACIFTLVFAIPVFFDCYVPTLSMAQNAKYSFLTGIALTLVIVHCNFMIARGRPHWARALVGLLGLCFLSMLPTLSEQPNKVMYALSLLLPLLGLLLLNSKRHREMRQKLLEVRHLREAMLARHKPR